VVAPANKNFDTRLLDRFGLQHYFAQAIILAFEGDLRFRPQFFQNFESLDGPRRSLLIFNSEIDKFFGNKADPDAENEPAA
jgi:hypothetical protein